MDHEGSFGLGETLHDARTATSDAVSKAADQMKDRFNEGTDYAWDMMGQLEEILPGKEPSLVRNRRLLICLTHSPSAMAP